MSTAERQLLSEDEYLALERDAATKHEYVNGEAVAMAGASPRHNRIVANLVTALMNRLGDGPCGPLPSDQRVHVPATGLYAYPDVTVLCGPGAYHERDGITLLNPTALIEVLSDSTEAYDRGAKLDHYRRLDSLREYLLVAERERRVIHYRRGDGAAWILTDCPPGDSVTLASLGVVLPLDEVYRRADSFPAG